jgi:hypothetical protein
MIYALLVLFLLIPIAWLATPLLLEIGYSYELFGRIPDLILVAAGGLLVAVILGVVVLSADNLAVFAIGFVAGLIIIAFISALSIFGGIKERELPE